MENNSRQLSELEGVCLGIVSGHAPCTAYRVRSELLASPSSTWCASAGSIYPLLNRLEKEGLVIASTDKNSGRNRKLLKVSSIGNKALRTWIMAGADSKLVSAVSDPIRSRMFFLSSLQPTERETYLNHVIAKMETLLAKANENLTLEAKVDDVYVFLGSLGALKVIETRLEWLKLVRQLSAKSNHSEIVGKYTSDNLC